MKRLKTITFIVGLFSLVALTACDDNRHISWSPDGKRLVVVGDSLHVAKADGTLSQLKIPGVNACQWFADNHHVLLLQERSEKNWNAIAPLLSAKEKTDAMAMAERLRAGHGTGHSLERIFDHSSSNGDVVMAYLYTKYGAQVLKNIFRHWQIRDLNTNFAGVNISVLQIFDLAENGLKATPGRILFEGRKGIQSASLSPNGKFIAISQSGDCCYKVSIISAINGTVKSVTDSFSPPAWSTDSQSIYFIKATAGKVAAKSSTIAVSAISKIAIADSSGKFLPEFKAEADLCQISASGGERLSVLPDGTLLFCSRAISLPVIGSDSGGKETLFKLDAQKKTITAIQPEESSLSSSLVSFEVNQDGSKVVLVTEKNAIYVLDLNSGKCDRVQGEIQTSLAFAPNWRNAHELCFPLYHTEAEKQARGNSHDFEVALINLTQEDNKKRADILSGAWPAGQFLFLKKAPSNTQKISDRNKLSKEKKRVVLIN